ncbi:MAG: 50S ribosomal protein L16 [Candidatus Heimdallarchaeota archaeon]|nr:50S ribosomal protein L16 [Candidatus Heimdallarchaeota archaeon]MCK4878508.1 50S ribosomal protein L16 [Candidatus Heimdallarchaeota archaeon]
MGKRPARCYTKVSGPANTRVGKYVRGVPDSRIRSYDTGNRKGDFPVHVHLVSTDKCQIRHTALEAARVAVNRHLQRNLGIENYHMTIRIHPHHILRENKMMAVAGADRIQDGMRKSFGKPTDRAARVKEGQEIVTVRTFATNYYVVKDALKRGADRFPTTCTYKIGKGEELIKELQKTGKFSKGLAKVKKPAEDEQSDEETAEETTEGTTEGTTEEEQSDEEQE